MATSLKKSAIDYSLIACSFHEAAHVLVAIYNLSYVSDVYVKIDGNDAIGLTSFDIYKDHIVEDSELFRLLLISSLQIYYAGLAGETHYYKDITGSETFPQHMKAGWVDDLKESITLIRQHNLATPGSETRAFKKRITKNADDILTEHWAEVKLVAHALYKRKKLTYDDLKNLLTRKIENKDIWKQKFKLIKFINLDLKSPTEKELKQILTETLYLI